MTYTVHTQHHCMAYYVKAKVSGGSIEGRAMDLSIQQDIWHINQITQSAQTSHRVQIGQTALNNQLV